MGMYPPPFTDPLEPARLRHLVKDAQKDEREAAAKIDNTQLASATERTQFFEKIAIGSGATIAALVSFLGTHLARLAPHWILRIALVSLAIALVAALYRNFRYPYYKLAFDKRSWLQARRYKSRQMSKLLQYDRRIISLHTGQPIDLDEWTIGFSKRDADLTTVIKSDTGRVKSVWRECSWAENICLAAIVVAMIALIVLAWCNF